MSDQHIIFEFCEGPIAGDKMNQLLDKAQNKFTTGAYCSFHGQVREDIIDGKAVQGIDYTAHKEIAEASAITILREATEKFTANYCAILHSLGKVRKGELCLYVIAGTGHRRASFEACEYIVERLKKELPIWGKEYFEDQTHVWKENKF